jgi:hypothetical protein
MGGRREIGIYDWTGGCIYTVAEGGRIISLYIHFLEADMYRIIFVL